MALKNSFLTTSLILLFLSIILQSLVDPNLFNIQYWDRDTWVNVLHFWLTFLSTYYLFSVIVEKGHEKINKLTSSVLLIILLIAAVISFLWVMVIDIAFYFFYYKIQSLSETTFYEFDVPLTVAILTIGSFYFYQKNFYSPIMQKNGESELKIEAFAGKESRLISTIDIAAIYLSENITWITLLNGKTFYTNKTLLDLTEIISNDDFFKLNRQTIISRKAVDGYERLDYQKLLIKSISNLEIKANLVVSKYNAPIFKKWLTNSGHN